MNNALNTAHEIIKLVKKSPHHEAMLQNIKQHMQEDSRNLSAVSNKVDCLCTGFTEYYCNYNILQELWHESLDIVKMQK